LTYGCGKTWFSGDDPYYLQQMRRWIDTHYVAYEVYFDVEDLPCRSMLLRKHFPKAASVYRTLW